MSRKEPESECKLCKTDQKMSRKEPESVHKWFQPDRREG